MNMSLVRHRPRLIAALSIVLASGALIGADHLPRMIDVPNESGVARTLSTEPVDPSNPFFQSLGTNGRACVTCHTPTDGWTIVPENVRQRFERSDGLDAIFRPNDGSNSPDADVSTVAARRDA